MSDGVAARQGEVALRRPPVRHIDPSAVLAPVVREGDDHGHPRMAIVVHAVRLALAAAVAPDERVARGARARLS